MTFGDALAGQRIFVDAKMFIYALAPEPTLGPPCYQFIERIRRKEIEGVTSAHVFSDVAHRLMSLEACATFAGISNVATSSNRTGSLRNNLLQGRFKETFGPVRGTVGRPCHNVRSSPTTTTFGHHSHRFDEKALLQTFPWASK